MQREYSYLIKLVHDAFQHGTKVMVHGLEHVCAPARNVHRQHITRHEIVPQFLFCAFGCACACVCMYMCMFIACVCACGYACSCSCACHCVYVHVNVHDHVPCACVCVCVCVCVYDNVCIRCVCVLYVACTTGTKFNRETRPVTSAPCAAMWDRCAPCAYSSSNLLGGVQRDSPYHDAYYFL